MPRWLPYAIGLTLLIAVLLTLTTPGYMLYLRIRSLGQPGFYRFRGKARVVQGSPLAWRTLMRQGPTLLNPEGSMGGLTSGNFDSDADQELILASSQTSLIYEADGSVHSLGARGLGLTYNLRAWDFNGDGIDELLPEASIYSFGKQIGKARKIPAGGLQTPTESPVLTLAGVELGALPTVALPRAPFFGDFNGDGRVEVVMDSFVQRGQDVVIYTAPGTQLGEIRPASGMAVAIADTDGDGRSELLVLEERLQTVACYAFPYGRTVLPGNWDAYLPSCSSGDVDGDGCEELHSPLGYAGLHTGGFVSLQLPADLLDTSDRNEPQLARMLLATSLAAPLVGDFLPDPGREIAVCGSLASEVRSLMIFNAQGAMLYREDFSGPIYNCCLLHSGGRDYLVVQLMDKLLISP